MFDGMRLPFDRTYYIGFGLIAVFGAICAVLVGSWIGAALLTAFALVNLGVGVSMRSQ